MIKSEKILINDNPTRWADQDVVRWFTIYCIEYFGEKNIHEIFLFGSRARGANMHGAPVSDKSDHDFYVILVDGAVWPEHYMRDLDFARRAAGISGIEILVSTDLSFREAAQTEGSFARDVVRLDVRVLGRVASQAPSTSNF